jgi:simple sugar transport system ATP-binding protein
LTGSGERATSQRVCSLGLPGARHLRLIFLKEILMDYRLELRGVSKSFGEVKSLRNIDFHVGTNEIVGLLGDNGAGKSTLIKIITGYHQPDSGEILFDGQPVKNLTVPKARALGVETVYQERALADLQTLWRNIFLGRELSGPLGFLSIGKMRHETNRLMVESMGFTSSAVSPDSVIKSFSGGEKQGVAIVRALYFQADLIVLDEPTMGLSLQETRKLVDFVRSIKAAGKSAIFIDHNVFHVYSVADRVVVLDRGRVAGEFLTKDITLDDLMEKMYHVAQTGSLD